MMSLSSEEEKRLADYSIILDVNNNTNDKTLRIKRVNKHPKRTIDAQLLQFLAGLALKQLYTMKWSACIMHFFLV